MEKLNRFFIDAVDTLEIEPFLIENSNNISTQDLKETMKKYENNLSSIYPYILIQ